MLKNLLCLLRCILFKVYNVDWVLFRCGKNAQYHSLNYGLIPIHTQFVVHVFIIYIRDADDIKLKFIRFEE